LHKRERKDFSVQATARERQDRTKTAIVQGEESDSFSPGSTCKGSIQPACRVRESKGHGGAQPAGSLASPNGGLKCASSTSSYTGLGKMTSPDGHSHPGDLSTPGLDAVGALHNGGGHNIAHKASPAGLNAHPVCTQNQGPKETPAPAVNTGVHAQTQLHLHMTQAPELFFPSRLATFPNQRLNPLNNSTRGLKLEGYLPLEASGEAAVPSFQALWEPPPNPAGPAAPVYK
ncbi:hypothetical protein P7K49_031324, partial [Saguinus oedipus]